MTKATVRDVAAMAEVSTATVSRVLSRSRPVGPDIVERVERAAKTLGYSGNSIARSLRRSRTDTIGMVIPSIVNPFFTSLVDSVEHEVDAAGMQLLLCDSRQDTEIERRHLESLIARQVDGIVVSPTHVIDSASAVRAAAASTALVQLDRKTEGTQTDWVGIDDAAALSQVIEHLVDGGVRSAAFIGSALDDSSSQRRLDGFGVHCRRLGVTTHDDWIKLGSFTIEWGEQAATEILSSPTRPDSLVCADDAIALGAYRACQRLGTSIPEDIQITGFDNTVYGEIVRPPLTSVDQPRHMIASEALRLLSDVISSTSADRGPVNIALSAVLVPRGSTRW